MSDLLTPRERFSLLVIDEPQDRFPVFPLVTSHAARVAGITVREYVTSGRAMARAQLAAQEQYGHDFISLFSEVGIIAEALGSEFTYPEDDLPMLSRPRWSSLPDVSDLSDGSDVSDRGRLRVYLDAIGSAYEARGDRVPVLAYIPAPFTTAQHLVETESFLLGLLLEPGKVRRLLDYATHAVIAFSRACINAGALPVLVDPLASGSVVSAGHYRDFCLPYEKKVIDYWHRYDLDVILHICGDTSGIIELMPDTGADLLSIDRIDLKQAVSKVGSRVRIIGNFDTTEIWLASADSIAERVEQMVAEARDCPMGFVAATGCEVPLAAPPENIMSFVQTAKSAGSNPAFGRRAPVT